MSDTDITMPLLGETIDEGTVSRWLVSEGASVNTDDVVLEVSTDKVDTEVTAPASGTIERIVVAEGETVAVGAVLASVATPMHSHVPAPSDASSVQNRRNRHSPRVRRLAREHGVDLALVKGTGPHGRMTAADLLSVIDDRKSPSGAVIPSGSTPSPVDHPAPNTGHEAVDGTVERLSRRRTLIAERMHRSVRETAQLTSVIEVDLTSVVRARETAKDSFRARCGVSISVLAFVARAAVRALAMHPVLHAALDLESGTVTYPSAVNLGIAVDAEDGLVVPVIRRADELTVGGLARRITELAARSRDGSATTDDYVGGTFTITNTGSRGVLLDTPILNPPQSSILGLGALTRRPVALIRDDGEEVIAVHSMAYLSLTYDHRLIDGADAARFLTIVKGQVEASATTWLEAVDTRGGG